MFYHMFLNEMKFDDTAYIFRKKAILFLGAFGTRSSLDRGSPETGYGLSILSPSKNLVDYLQRKFIMKLFISATSFIAVT